MTQTRIKKEPRVGIFWLFKGRLILDSTPVSQGEAYGGNVGHATAHIDYWSRLQQQHGVPPEAEYDEVPRGRVVYNTKTEQYVLMADKHILAESKVVKEILRELHLPNNTTLDGTDFHYRCFKCRFGEHDDDDDDE